VLKEPNWRPRFKLYHPLTALAGLGLALFIMFYTNPAAAGGAIAAVIGLHTYIHYRKVESQWGDGMEGLRYQRARTALLVLEKNASMHTKNWRPQILMFAKVRGAGSEEHEGTLHQPKLLDFLGQLKGARGISIISTAVEGVLEDDAAVQMHIENELRKQRDAGGIRGFTQARPPAGPGPFARGAA